VQRIDQVREQRFATYGELPDYEASLRQDHLRYNQSPRSIK
jgi:hypothetical protein